MNRRPIPRDFPRLIFGHTYRTGEARELSIQGAKFLTFMLREQLKASAVLMDMPAMELQGLGVLPFVETATQQAIPLGTLGTLVLYTMPWPPELQQYKGFYVFAVGVTASWRRGQQPLQRAISQHVTQLLHDMGVDPEARRTTYGYVGGPVKHYVWVDAVAQPVQENDEDEQEAMYE